MTGCPLFLEFGENAGVVGIQPGWGHAGHDAFAVTTAFPEGDDDVFEVATGLFIHPEPHFLAAVQDIEVLEGMDVNLRVGGRGFGGWSTFADDEFTVIDAEGFVGQQELEPFGPLNGNGVVGINVVFVKLGQQQATFR